MVTKGDLITVPLPNIKPTPPRLHHGKDEYEKYFSAFKGDVFDYNFEKIGDQGVISEALAKANPSLGDAITVLSN
jgi:hypothetical protein